VLGLLLKLKNFLLKINWAAVGLVIVIVGSFYLGYQYKAGQVAKKENKELVQAKKVDAHAIKRQVELNLKAEEKKEQVRTVTKYVTKEIVKYVPQTILSGEAVRENDCSCASPTLSVGAVWLLNAARQGTSPDTSNWSAEEVQAPTDIGLQELAVSDTELAGQYNELAADHDSCVEYVQGLVADQQRRLGIKP